MVDQKYLRRSAVPAPAETVYRWHARPGAFERLSPPWQDVRVVSRTGGIETDGSRVTLSVPVGPIRLKWISEHTDAVPGSQFRDVQKDGPFARWQHTHRFLRSENGSGSILEDEIHYALPMGFLGRALGGAAIRKDLDRMFRFRHDATREDLAVHARYAAQPKQRFLVSGSSGLVGGALIPFLTTGGHEVVRLVRRSSEDEKEILWNPDKGITDLERLEGIDTVVHLAGENVSDGRWSAEKKQRIRASRVQGTETLARALAKMKRPPKVLISASAIGVYGNRGDRLVAPTEDDGLGFLAQVCRDWEAATKPAADRGIRVVNLRIGIVLSPKGGALAKMLLPFRMGLGGVVGDGSQIMSWISLDDLVGLILHAAMDRELVGALNAVAPSPVTNRDFTATLGKVLRRPAVLPMPRIAARLAFGEMADELLLSSIRVEPGEAVSSAFSFRHPELETGLRHMLGRQLGDGDGASS